MELQIQNYCGTTKLIEDFIHNMCTALDYIANNNLDNIRFVSNS